MTHNILVVDDDQELRENIREILDEAGFAVTVAVNGEEALACLERQAFAVVLLDLIMPGKGGMETLALIRQRHLHTRVIMLTAFATVENAVEAMRRGADDYLAKPFRVGELLTTVRRVLEEARLRKGHTVLDMDATFGCLANPLRREILRLLNRERRLRFMDIARSLGVSDHTKINFHVKMLRDAELLCQDERKFYHLTRAGEKLVDCLEQLTQNLTN